VEPDFHVTDKIVFCVFRKAGAQVSGEIPAKQHHTHCDRAEPKAGHSVHVLR